MNPDRPGGRAGRYRLLAAALALMGAGLATVLGPPARGAAAVPAAVPAVRTPAAPVASGSPPPLAVTIDAMSPITAVNGATLTVRGTVHNAGTRTTSGLELLLGVGSPPSSRADLFRDFTDPPGITRVLSECSSCLVPTLAPGASAPYTVTVDLGDQLDRQVVSVYPLAVRVLGIDAAGYSGATLGEADTFLPYVQQTVASPLRVSWLLPLDPPPVLSATGAIRAPDFPASLSTGGRLQQLLAASTPPPPTRGTAPLPGFAPVTYAVEPTLLAAAAQTAHQGWRRVGDPTTGAGRGPDVGSAAFLAALTARTAGQGVLALPSADPDAVALARAGLGLDLSTETATGRSDVGAQLPGADVLSGYGWLPGDAVDQPTLTAYASAGVSTLVLPGTQLPAPDAAFPPTQTAVTTLPTTGPTVRGLVTDPDLQALLATAGHDAPTARVSAGRLLAVLALTVGEAPNDQAARDVVLALPRGVDPAAGWLRTVLSDTGSVSWLNAVPLADTAGDPAGQRLPLAPYPAQARAAELPQDTLSGAPGSVTDLRAAVAALGSTLPDTTLTRPLERALNRAESFAWRADPAGSSALRDGVAAQTHALLGQVQLAAADTVTLASQHASIPITVENGLPEKVSVRITLQASDRTKLRTASQLVTVLPHRKLRVLLPADTQRAGTFRAAIITTTPSGGPVARTSLVVHSRAYGRVTLLITFGALAVLLAAIGVRTVRRLRHRPPGGPGRGGNGDDGQPGPGSSPDATLPVPAGSAAP